MSLFIPIIFYIVKDTTIDNDINNDSKFQL